MTRKLATAITTALLFGFGSAMLTEATARQSHGGGGRAVGGHSGGGHASFAARSGGAARFSASAAGFGFSARAAAPAFIGVAPQRFNAHAGTGRRVVHRSHGRTYGYVAAIGIPLVSYGYVNSSYHHCAWLKARYEDTGLRKWRLRYEACRDGDDD